ncbi:MAG: dihydropteroate synthase [Rhodospirillales bacterium]|nr:dihydropteroate synthase [Rhodospirillales bacterium]
MHREDPPPAPLRWAGLLLDRPRVMGILNVTPDSFSDGGRHADPARAIAAGLAMAEAGADIVDIGGESTRPGAPAVPAAEEQARILPVIRALAAAGIRLSVDTRNAATMAAALDAGAAIINDVSALAHDPAAPWLLAARGAPVVLMHMRGTPATMMAHAQYTDPVAEVAAELAASRDRALAAGIAPEAIALDPGIGFAKRLEHNLALLRGLERIAALGCPVLVGLSRKRFIGTIAGQADPAGRLAGSLAAGLFARAHGAHILRVHDVPETIAALKLWTALDVPATLVDPSLAEHGIVPVSAPPPDAA